MGTVRSGGLETKVTSGASVLPLPPKKRGRLVVSNRISQRLISSLFVPRARGCAFNRRVANCGSRALGTTYV